MRVYNQKRRALYGSDLGYGGEWRRISKAYLRAHPQCMECGAPATETDHIRPRPRGARVDRSTHDRDENLQALCKRCHRSKTMRETNARRCA